jgi:hypothetical protein
MYAYRFKQNILIDWSKIEDIPTYFTLPEIILFGEEKTVSIVIECIFTLDYSLEQALNTDLEGMTQKILDRHGCEVGELESFSIEHLNGDVIIMG